MRRPFCLSALPLLALACSGLSDESRSSSLSRSYVIAGNTEGAPSGCDMADVARRTDELFEAITEGASGISSKFFGSPEKAPFQWYSFEDFVARSLDDLDADSASRHAAGYRLSLRGIDFIGWTPERAVVGLSPIFFDYQIANSPAHTPQVQLGLGKAEYHCASSKFVVMSLGPLEEEQWHALYQIHLAGGRTVQAAN